MMSNTRTPARAEAPEKKRFVIIVAVDESARNLVLLTKNKGPSQLIGKATFPGGVEEAFDGSAEAAGRRELLEETGVDAPLAAFQLVDIHTNETRHLKTIFVSCDISAARTMETEVVFLSSIDAVMCQLETDGADRFAPDMAERLAVVLPRIAAIRAARREVAPTQAEDPSAVEVGAPPSPTRRPRM